MSLSGTLNNCAGGPTPWGSWISCEETTLGNTTYLDDDERVGGFGKPHGYLTLGGKIADFARNILDSYPETEVAGATFSPDGATLFFNLQTPGIYRRGVGRLQRFHE